MSTSERISSPSPEARIFTVFPKLPIELRLAIWKITGRDQRVIKFVESSFDPEWDDEDIAFSRFRGIELDITHTIPGVVHANQEARQAVLKKYEITTFIARFRGQHVSMSGPLYFNFFRDVLYVDDKVLLPKIAAMECLRLGGVKDVPSEIRHLMVGGGWRNAAQLILRNRFVNLETVTLERQVTYSTAFATDINKLKREEEEQHLASASILMGRLRDWENEKLVIKFASGEEMEKIGEGGQITTTIMC